MSEKKDKDLELAIEKALAKQEEKHKKEIQKAVELAIEASKKSAYLEKGKLKSATKKDDSTRKGVWITYGGTYYYKKDSITRPESYEVEIQLTDNPDYRLPADGHLIKVGRLKLLPFYFKENQEEYPFFNAIREVKILDIKTHGATINFSHARKLKPIEEMTMKELNKFTIDKNLVTNPSDFTSIRSARKAVIEEWENRKIAEEAQYGSEEKEEKKRKEEFAEVKELLEFNKIAI
jgi:hypothetical protein